MKNETHRTKSQLGARQSSPNSNLATRLPKIVVIDSGAGGLSIAVEILKLISSIEVFYTADTAYFPFGEMTKTKLLERLDYLVSQAQEQFNPDLFVLACNTASTIGLEYLRQKYSASIVGVVPAIKPAAKYSKTGSFAVLATRGTVTTDYIKDLVDTFAADKTVSYLGTNELVQIAEEYIAGKTICNQSIENLLITLIKTAGLENMNQCDTLVLACTHFPLIKDQIAQAFHSAVSKMENETLKDEQQPRTSHLNRELFVLDSGEAIAKRVLSVLISEHNYLPALENTSVAANQSITIITSSDASSANASLGYEEYLQSKTIGPLKIQPARVLP